MTDDKSPVIARRFIKNLSRGAMESIPFGGTLLEQVIRGTLSDEAAREEVAKLQSALSEILEKVKGQDVRFADVIDGLKKEVTLREEIRAEMGKIAALLEDPENAAVSERLASAVERMTVERMTVHNLPCPSIGGLFKGREDVVDRLRCELERGRTVAITQAQAIHRLSGVGKTRLAVEYAWRALEARKYLAVFFVNADTQGSLNRNLAGLAGPGLLNLPEHNIPEQPIIIEAVLRELEKRTDWLLILDNLDSKDTAIELCEKVLQRLKGGHVLITSQRSDWLSGVVDLPIDKLKEPDAVTYLSEKSKGRRVLPADDASSAGEIANKLDGLAIALEQAGSYINRRHISFDAYLEDFDKSRQKVLLWRKRDLMDYPASVLAAWQTIEERLGPGERGILRLASFLSPGPIPVALFESQPEIIKDAAVLALEEMGTGTKCGGIEGELNVWYLLSELAEWSMITLTQESFSIHQLIQDFIRLGISQKKCMAWAELAFGLMNGYIPNEPRPDDVRSRPLWDSIESHVAALVGHADDFYNPEPTSRLMNELGLYLKSRERFGEAEPLYVQALEIDEKSFGTEHPKVSVRLNNLAQLFQATGRFEQAESLMRWALEIDEKLFGREHPKVAIRLNNLAELLRATNRFEQAEPLLRRAIGILENRKGKQLENYAAALNNLAQLLRVTNRLKDAEPLIRRALEIDEKILGPEHSKIAVRLDNLAQLLKVMNRLKESEPLMRRALEIDEKSFGREHPKVAVRLNNLAQLLKMMNRLNEAEPLMRRALEIDEKSFCPDHPTVAVRLNNLAQLLQATKCFKDAEPLMQRALRIDEKLFGPEHPKIAVRLNNLAGLFEGTNRLGQAEPLMRRAIRILENSKGGPAGTYAASLSNLAQLLKVTNRLGEAEPLMRRALEIDEKLFGPSHPHVAVDLNNLAQLLSATDRSKKARPLMRRAFGILKKSLGAEHPKSQTVRKNLEALK